MEDKILKQFGIEWKDLQPIEKETLQTWLNDLKTKKLTLEHVQEYIKILREAAENEVTKAQDLPTTWLSLVSLFIPFYGLIKKWYVDKQALEARSRLRVYSLIEAFLDGPKKAEKALEKQLAMFPKSK